MACREDGKFTQHSFTDFTVSVVSDGMESVGIYYVRMHFIYGYMLLKYIICVDRYMPSYR